MKIMIDIDSSTAKRIPDIYDYLVEASDYVPDNFIKYLVDCCDILNLIEEEIEGMEC